MTTLHAVNTVTGEIEEVSGLDPCSDWLVAHGFPWARACRMLRHAHVQGFALYYENQWRVRMTSWS